VLFPLTWETRTRDLRAFGWVLEWEDRTGKTQTNMMRRAPPKFDISITGDEQEQSRIQLENNLLHTDLSLHLTSSTHDDYSVENPRHHPGVSAPFSAFNSMDRSRDALDMDEGLSQLHAWSYRTGEDDEGVHPFVGGETLSTAAHHASALTLSAGLAGRGDRRDVSLSGAEYDPERPLQDLIAGIGAQFNLYDAEKAPSRHAVSLHLSITPLCFMNFPSIYSQTLLISTLS
jgi:hypothetical protein